MHRFFRPTSLLAYTGIGLVMASCSMMQMQQQPPSAQYQRQAPLMNPSSERAIASGETPVIHSGGMDGNAVAPAYPQAMAPTNMPPTNSGRRRPAMQDGSQTAPAMAAPSPMPMPASPQYAMSPQHMAGAPAPIEPVSQAAMHHPDWQPAAPTPAGMPITTEQAQANNRDAELRAMVSAGVDESVVTGADWQTVPADGIPEDNYTPPQHELPSIPHQQQAMAQPMPPAPQAQHAPMHNEERLKAGMWSDFFDFSYQKEPGEQPAYPTLSEVPEQPPQRTPSEYQDDIAALEAERAMSEQLRAQDRDETELAPVVRTPPAPAMPSAPAMAAMPTPSTPYAMQPPATQQGRRRPANMQATPSYAALPSGPIQAESTGIVPPLPVMPNQMPPATYGAAPAQGVMAEPLHAEGGTREPDDQVLERIAVGAPPKVLGTTAVPAYVPRQDMRARPYNPAANRVTLRPPSDTPAGVRTLPKSRYAARRRSNYR